MSDTNVKIILEVVDKNASVNTKKVSESFKEIERVSSKSLTTMRKQMTTTAALSKQKWKEQQDAAKISIEDQRARLIKFGIALAAIGVVAKKAFDFVKEVTLLSARVETLGIVTETMGRNVGFTVQEIRGFEESIQSMGITTIASREAIAQLIRAEIDLSESSKLARIAQDAAVIGGENSSQAFAALAVIISTGNTLMARSRGLMVDFQGANEDMAAQLGKTVGELTEAEKAQARLGEVMKQGKTITGVYEAAMDTAGKQALSYARVLEELKVATGVKFQDEFKKSINIVTEFTKTLTELTQAENALDKALELGLISVFDYNLEVLKIVFTEKEAIEVFDELVISILEQEAALREIEETTRTVRSVNVDYRDSIKKVTTSMLLQVDAAKLLKEQQKKLNEVLGLVGFSEDVDEVRESLEELRTEEQLLQDQLLGGELILSAADQESLDVALLRIIEINQEVEDLDAGGPLSELIALQDEMIETRGIVKDLTGGFITMDGQTFDGLTDELDGIQTEIGEVEAAWLRQSQQMILGKLAEQAALDGVVTDEEILAIQALGIEWGLVGTDALTAALFVGQAIDDMDGDISGITTGSMQTLLEQYATLIDKDITITTRFNTIGSPPSFAGGGGVQEDPFFGTTIPVTPTPSVITGGGNPNISVSEFGFGFARGTSRFPGGSLRIPPGFENDGFPMRVSSGEEVSVTPRGQSRNGNVGITKEEMEGIMLRTLIEFSQIIGANTNTINRSIFEDII